MVLFVKVKGFGSDEDEGLRLLGRVGYLVLLVGGGFEFVVEFGGCVVVVKVVGG